MKYHLRKIVPNSRLNSYLQLGWVETSGNGESTEITKTLLIKSPEQHYDCGFHNPTLIQRGKIRRPLHTQKGGTLSAAVQFDYMGASEFEYGALPRSLKRVEAQYLLYQPYTFDIIAAVNGKDMPLQVYANFDSDEQRLQYQQALIDVANRKIKTHEATYLTVDMFGKIALSTGCDFWWDIKNDVFFSFDKQFMSRIDGHLRSSFLAMGFEG